MARARYTACAACKFSRRKCRAECPLAPWFPPEEPKRFANVHRLFGMANVLKLFSANQGQLEDLVKSIVYEADARSRDPVNGAFGILQALHKRQVRLEHEQEKLKHIYAAMLVEEAKLAGQPAVYLSSNPRQVHRLEGPGTIGAPSANLHYSRGTRESLWDLQTGMRSRQNY